MEFILDTANLTEIKKYHEMIHLAGVTTNPSICKKENIENFWEHMNKIRAIIGLDRSFHVQVVAKDYDGMIEDAEAILKNIDEQVFIKVPTTEVGLRVMKELKRREHNVTATGIYTKMQAYLAINIGVDYLAPYYNRMENHNIDAQEAILEIANIINRTQSPSKILAASFKNVSQVTTAIEHGAHAITAGSDVFETALNLPFIGQAVSDFTTDWEGLYEKGDTVSTI